MITIHLEPAAQKVIAAIGRAAEGAGDSRGRVERLAEGEVQARASAVGPRHGALPSGRGWSRCSSCTPRPSTSIRTRRCSPSARRRIRQRAGSEARDVLHDRHGRGPRRAEQRAVRRGRLSRAVRGRLRERERDDALRAGAAATKGLFFCLFDTPDRVQHMFWRFGEQGIPANRATPPRDGARDRGSLPRAATRSSARRCIRRRPDTVHRAQRSRDEQLSARRPSEYLASR